MSLVTSGLVGGLVTMLIGVMWLAFKMMKNDDKRIVVPLVCLCWGGIVFLTCFRLGAKREGVTSHELDLLHLFDPYLIGIAIFVFSIPICMWLQEHGWEDKKICRILYGVICIAVAVPLVLYQLMK